MWRALLQQARTRTAGHRGASPPRGGAGALLLAGCVLPSLTTPPQLGSQPRHLTEFLQFGMQPQRNQNHKNMCVGPILIALFFMFTRRHSSGFEKAFVGHSKAFGVQIGHSGISHIFEHYQLLQNCV